MGKSTLLLQLAAMVASACSEPAGRHQTRGGTAAAASQQRSFAAQQQGWHSSEDGAHKDGAAASACAAHVGRPVLYVSAEESKNQVWGIFEVGSRRLWWGFW